jgi:drug/metabolite transporter (DMT)-like permease
MTNNLRGMLMMVLTVFLFAAQDGFSRYLAGEYNTLMVVMIRYWGFGLFVIALALRQPEGPRAAIKAKHLGLHIWRGGLLVAEIAIMVWAYTLIGLIETHAIFATTPLVVLVLSVFLLGERANAARWIAVAMGLVGVLIILRPGAGIFSWASVLPFASAVLFGLYSVLTRKASQLDRPFAVFFWPAVVGMVLATVLGLPNWQAIAPADWPAMLGYVVICIASNWTMQKTYSMAEASVLQPFAYLQIVFVSVIAVVIFGETLALPVAVGTGSVIAAGLFALRSERGRDG